MPDSKISGLTSATTPLAGTEVLPIVQSGVTKQVSVANLTAGRAMSAGLITSTGGLVAPGVLTNFADPSGWNTGTGTATGYFGGNFTANGTVAAEDTRQYSSTPVVSPGLVWSATSSDTASDAEGGWTKTITGLVDSKTYRSVVWVRRVTASTSGSFYHGCSTVTTLNLNGTTNTNPYFGVTSISGLVQDRWYLSVGYIHANADASVTSYGGLYDSTTGAKVANYTDYKLSSGATSQVHRTFLYYSTDTTTQLDLWGPRFEEVTGNEPSVYSMLLSSSNNVATATALQNTRTLWGQNFNGTANVTGSLTSVGNITGTAGVTLTATAGTLGLVATGANVITASTNGSERMRITSAGDVGIGTSSPASKLHVVGDIQQDNANYIKGKLAAGTATRLFGLNAADSLYIGGIDASQSQTLFVRGGTTQMTITAAGDVGIGTSSPGSLLHLNANNAEMRLSEVGTYYGSIRVDSAGGLTIASDPSNVAANSRLIFSVDNTERMRLDSAGNLGLGVTPSAWDSIFRAVQVGSANYFSFASQNSASCYGSILWNAYGTGNETFAYNKTGDRATRFAQQYDFRWYLAPSGTAGSTISFTEAMRITSAGNVGIGTSSPTNTLSVAGNANITGNTTLGDASTDTVTVNGYMGVGGAPNGAFGVWAKGTAQSGTTQYAFYSSYTGSTTGTSQLVSFLSSLNVPDSAYTVAHVAGFYSVNATKGASATITNQHGLYIADQTQGTNNFGVTSLVSSGSNKWNIYASGTAQNYFAGNVGIGTGSPSVKLEVSGASSGATLELLRLSNTGTGANTKARINFYAASGNYGSITGGYGASSPEMVFDINTTAGAYIWNNNATEQMRITSTGNVGIGTSSPVAKLTVGNLPVSESGSTSYGSGLIRGIDYTLSNTQRGILDVEMSALGAQNKGATLTFTNNVSHFGQGLSYVGAAFKAGKESAVNTIQSTYLAIHTNNGGTLAERLRIDSSGNLGLGVTPSAWTTVVPAIQLGSAGAFLAAQGSSTNVRMGVNAYYNGGYIYTINGAASMYQQAAGVHSWHQAASGTAGNAISFTQAMTLDASGNLGIGTSSPSAKLSINQTVSSALTSSIFINGNYPAGNLSHGVAFSINGGGAAAGLYVGDSNTGSASLVFTTSPSFSSPTNTEQMRITSTGHVGIGTSSPTPIYGKTLQIGSGASEASTSLVGSTGSVFLATVGATGQLIARSGMALVLGSNDVERMRITSAGDVGIGTSSPSAKLDVVGNVEATGFLDGPLYDSAFKRFTNPGGGIYTTTTASVTGAIRITFPVGATNTMVKVTVKVYEYQTNRSFEIHFGGYTSTSGPSWANNPYAYIVGNPTINRQFTVRLGYDSTATKMVAYIGELASTWAYPQVYITEVQCGYAGFSANFATGWAIGFEATAFQNVTATISNPQVGYQAVAGDAIQGSVRYTSTTNTAGCFYGGSTTPTGTTRLNYSGYLYPTYLNLIGSADTTTAATHYFVEQSSDGFVRPKTIANVRTEIVTTAAVSAATAAGAIAFSAGTAAAPSIYPTGDTNTGIFFPAADTIAFSEGGAESMRITSAGNIHTPAGATTMTDGFIYIPSAGGTPTGAATAITGTVPLYYDTTNNKLFVYNSSWQNVATAGSLPLVATNANGVVYLNSSSQATTSTALQFNGTELGIGQAASAGIQVDVTTTALAQIRARATTNGVDSRLAANSSGLLGYVGTISNHDFAVYTNNTERARVTAAGVLQLSPVSSEGGELNLLNPTGGTVGGYVDVSTANNFRLWTGNLNATMQIGQLSSTGGNIQFFTEASEKMRLTAAGDLGIGVSSPSQKLHVNAGNIYVSNTVAGNAFCLVYNGSAAAGSAAVFALWNDNGLSANSVAINFYSSGSTIPNELRIANGANAPMTFYTNGSERMRITGGGNFLTTQAAHSTVNTATTLNITQVQSGIIVSTPATNITITLPTGTTLETYTTNMPVGFSFELTIILVTGSGGTDITIAANGNTYYGGANVTFNGPATLRFRKTATNTFSVYRIA